MEDSTIGVQDRRVKRMNIGHSENTLPMPRRMSDSVRPAGRRQVAEQNEQDSTQNAVGRHLKDCTMPRDNGSPGIRHS